MDLDPNLVNLFVSYVGNVGADATRWVAGKFTRSKETTDVDAVELEGHKLNYSLQAELQVRGVSDSEAVKVADYIIKTPTIGYLQMMVQAADTSEYVEYAIQEIAAIFSLECELASTAARISAEAVVELIGASNKTGVMYDSIMRAEQHTLLSGIQLFGAREARARFMTNIGNPSLSDIQAYSQIHRGAMARKYARIQLQHIDGGTEERLEDLYVEPDLLAATQWIEGSHKVTPAQVIKESARAVIQGPAGSGKSTTVRKLASQIAAWPDSLIIPIVVELRKYSAQQVLNPSAILDHISAQSGLLTQQAPPKSWLEYMLATGGTVVFFDGLDEVLNAGTRAEVRDAVLAFAQLFPSTSIVVTSRYTGYDLAPLDENEWAHFGVRELAENQVKEYAERWFGLKSPEGEGESRSVGFLRESAKYAPDLRANPLMLSLLCSVYYARGDMPRTLHQLYERCADLIYQQWNTMRGIDDHYAWAKDVRPVLYQVAHAVLMSEEYQSAGIPEAHLHREIRNAFLKNGAPDHDEASKRARMTVRLWSGRAWIITVVSTDADGRRRYGFVHQSFLEFFAAVFEVRRVDAPEDLFENLRPRLIHLNGWSVTQVAVSVVQDYRDGGGVRFLDALMQNARSSCDLDALALWRLAISLVEILSLPVKSIHNICTGLVEFVARSIIMPEMNSTTAFSREESDLRAQSLLDYESSLGRIPSSRRKSNERDQIKIPTSTADQVFVDLAEACHLHSFVWKTVQQTLTDLCRHRDDRFVASALLALLVFERAELPSIPVQIDIEEDSIDDQDRSWIVYWMYAQQGAIALQDAVAKVPWHAVLLEQEMVRASDIEVCGPSFLGKDLRSAIDSDSSYKILQTIGARLVTDLLAGNLPAGVGASEVRAAFVFHEPDGDWSPARDPGEWDDDFLVAFTLIARMANVAWESGHALGEMFAETDRDVVHSIIRQAVGWGQVDEVDLEQVGEGHRLAIREILSSRRFVGD
ncbi:NACHT domain-containing protein [Microcella daejeonensis]|uniref:NACHT domain-containing protein n=1 Tax=Microcella daejeonensis TaxID=2994971 RepID=A0A9E8MKT6_9MICO|nr:NACHT domain-containing protein [Microcella daejeonensis]WAB80611.1 NACHT domain-containing protein [Microcella daejeonensis]